MSLAWLNKIAVRIEKKQGSLFSCPIDKQKAYLRRFKTPKDEFQRSYYQYCCQMRLYGRPLHFALNLVALPMSVILLHKYKRNVRKLEQKVDCVFAADRLPGSIIPNSLRQRYASILSLFCDDNSLTAKDVAFLKGIIKRYPLSWFLWLKMIIKVSQYSAFITKHAPAAIISCDEFSFTSSAVTAYCRGKGIKRINVMHGEKLYYMRDSFMEYDEYYVWDQHYVDLLTDMGAKKDQFRIELPASMHIEKQDDVHVQYNYTYYLGSESPEALRAIAGTMRLLHNKGQHICIRPHPRYSDPKLIAELFCFANIEDCKAISIEQSLLQTGVAVSLYSTVLNQAVGSSIPIVIDDVSNPSRFEKLKQLRYICLHKEHKLLSEIIREV